MSQLPETLETALLEASAKVFGEIVTAGATPDRWEHMLACLRRHELLETVVSAPYTKLGWQRHTIVPDRVRLGDPAYVREISQWLAREWVALLKRKLSPASVPVLLSMDAAVLLECLSCLYLNQSTGDGVAHFVLARIAAQLVGESPAVEATLAALDKRFEVVGPILDRNTGRALLALSQGTEAGFAELSRQTTSNFALVGEVLKARYAPLEHELQQGRYAARDVKSHPEVGFGIHLPEPQGLYRKGHEKEDLWFHQQDREVIEALHKQDPSPDAASDAVHHSEESSR